MRSNAERVADTITALEQQSECWIATGRPDGSAHLIPLSFAWDGAKILLATFTDSVTTRAVSSTGRVQFSLPSTTDVVLIDADAAVREVGELADHLYERFVRQAGFHPRRTVDRFSFLVLTPVRVLAWRSEEELIGREIMKAGVWRSAE